MTKTQQVSQDICRFPEIPARVREKENHFSLSLSFYTAICLAHACRFLRKWIFQDDC